MEGRGHEPEKAIFIMDQIFHLNHGKVQICGNRVIINLFPPLQLLLLNTGTVSIRILKNICRSIKADFKHKMYNPNERVQALGS